MLWAQGNLQRFLPHDIMIVARRDFALCLIQFDIVSATPPMRAEQAHNANLTPILKRLFDYWSTHSHAPFQLSMNEGIFPTDVLSNNGLDGNFRHMKSALVHAIKDVRGEGSDDCLYVLMSAVAGAAAADRGILEILLPYIDSALRRFMRDTGDDHVASTEAGSVDPDFGALSSREREIMEWVKNGKTNFEIGMILNISAFTVKNHMQRIFRKLNVVNRAQAVARLGKALELTESV
jgi:transcriptional regulator EpsA